MPGRVPVEIEGTVLQDKEKRGMIRKQDKSEDRSEGRSKAHETRSRELEPLGALNSADGQAGRRRTSRCESVASRELPRQQRQRNRREIVQEARGPGQWRLTLGRLGIR